MSNKQKRKPVEDIIDELKKQVKGKVLGVEPVKKFPEDFLDEATKKELGIPIKYPKLLKSGVKIIGREHRIRLAKIDPNKINETLALIKEWEKGLAAKYEEILLPEMELKLKIERKVEICSAKSGIALMKFDSLERAEYVLYSRKKGQLIYKIPKDEEAVKKAVQKYEKYLTEIRDRLIRAFIKRGAVEKIADSLARQIFEEIDLPMV